MRNGILMSTETIKHYSYLFVAFRENWVRMQIKIKKFVTRRYNRPSNTH